MSSSRDSSFCEKLDFSYFTCVTFTFYSCDFDILIGIFVNQGLYTTWWGSDCFESLWNKIFVLYVGLFRCPKHQKTILTEKFKSHQIQENYQIYQNRQIYVSYLTQLEWTVQARLTYNLKNYYIYQFTFWYGNIYVSKWNKWGGWRGFRLVRSAEISSYLCWFFIIMI